MRSSHVALCVIIASGVVALMTPAPAHAVCRTVEASHNGTDMFHESGAQGAAVNKLLVKVKLLKNEEAPRLVRLGQVRTKCGPWFQKYMLQHRHCVAKAQVCY